jgi:hypothetical protein
MRKGDIVTIKATVTTFGHGAETDGPFAGKLRVQPFGHYDNIYVSADAVEMLTPFFEKNDPVVTPHQLRGSVIGTFDDHVWVRLNNGNLETHLAQDLSREYPEAASDAQAA